MYVLSVFKVVSEFVPRWVVSFVCITFFKWVNNVIYLTLWKKSLRIISKVKMFSSSVKAVLLYASNEFWTITQRTWGGLQVFINKCLREIFGAVAIDMNYLDFEVQRDCIWNTFSHLRYLQNAWTYFSETYHNYSLPGPHDTGEILKVMGSEVKVLDNFFWKCTFWHRHTNRRFTIEDHLFGNLFRSVEYNVLSSWSELRSIILYCVICDYLHLFFHLVWYAV